MTTAPLPVAGSFMKIQSRKLLEGDKRKQSRGWGMCKCLAQVTAPPVPAGTARMLFTPCERLQNCILTLLLSLHEGGKNGKKGERPIYGY